MEGPFPNDNIQKQGLTLIRRELRVCVYVHIHRHIMCDQASQVALVVENLPANAGDTRDVGLISGRGQSPGVGNGTPLQNTYMGFPDGSGVRNLHTNAGDAEHSGSVPGSGRPPSNPLQNSCLENFMDRGVWLATVQVLQKNWTQLSNGAHRHIYIYVRVYGCAFLKRRDFSL